MSIQWKPKLSSVDPSAPARPRCSHEPGHPASSAGRDCNRTSTLESPALEIGSVRFARNAKQYCRHVALRPGPVRAAHAMGASGTGLLENQFYGCLAPRLYNCERPHSSLDYRTPEEFKRVCEESRAMTLLSSQTSTINTTLRRAATDFGFDGVECGDALDRFGSGGRGVRRYGSRGTIRMSIRQARAGPLLDSLLRTWLELTLVKLSRKSDTAAAIRYPPSDHAVRGSHSRWRASSSPAPRAPVNDKLACGRLIRCRRLAKIHSYEPAHRDRVIKRLLDRGVRYDRTTAAESRS